MASASALSCLWKNSVNDGHNVRKHQFEAELEMLRLGLEALWRYLKPFFHRLQSGMLVTPLSSVILDVTSRKKAEAMQLHES